MGRVTWPVRVTYLPPLSLGAYKSGLSPHLGAPSGSSSGPVTASAHRVVSRHGMSRQDYAASEPDADGGYLQITVAPRREAAKLPRGPQLQLLTSNAPRSEHGARPGQHRNAPRHGHLRRSHARVGFCSTVLPPGLSVPRFPDGSHGCLHGLDRALLMSALGLVSRGYARPGHVVSRVLVHRMDDTVRGQRIGAWTWTLLTVLAFTSYMYGLLTNPAACGQIDRLLEMSLSLFPSCTL